MKRFHILILDEDRLCLGKLSSVLEKQNFKVYCANTAKSAFETLSHHTVDFFFCNIILSGSSGLEVLLKAKKSYPHLDVIMISDQQNINQVIKSFRYGAVDYINKPMTLDEMLEAIKRTEKYNNSVVTKVPGTSQWSLIPTSLIRRIGREFIGRGDKIKEVLRLGILASGEKDLNILITGENGTGKEILARIVHHTSDRKTEKFCPINCAAVPDTLIESEFFGHKKGTFTGAIEDKKGCFEQAHEGTLFLDEIAEMPFSLQAKLLRAIEEKKIKPLGSNQELQFNFRIISATNSKPDRMLEEKKLREDLFHRLSTFILHIPPLRERYEDVSPLTLYFVNQISSRRKESEKWIHPEVFDHLKSYHFPGNVRELRNMVERAMLLANTGPLTPKHFHLPTKEKEVEEIEILNLNMEENEKTLIANALLQTNSNFTKAAKLLGISRDTLIRKKKKFDIS